MSKVTFKTNKENQMVTPYSGNPEYGYVIVSSVQNTIKNGWMQKVERSTILRGEVNALAEMTASTKSLPGSIAVTECLEDNIPTRFSDSFNKELSFEDQIEPFIKRAGKDGPTLRDGDAAILRFTEYDATGEQTDVRIAHTNGDEVKAFNATKKNAEANLG